MRAQHQERAVDFLAKELKVCNPKDAEERVFFVSAKETLQARLQEQKGQPAHSEYLVLLSLQKIKSINLTNCRWRTRRWFSESLFRVSRFWTQVRRVYFKICSENQVWATFPARKAYLYVSYLCKITRNQCQCSTFILDEKYSCAEKFAKRWMKY